MLDVEKKKALLAAEEERIAELARTLIAIEHGSRNFTVDVLDRVAQAPDVPIWLLLVPCWHLTG